MKFADKLRRLGACKEGLAWVGDRTLDEAWAECLDPQWMIWYLGKVGTHQDVVLAGCACARTALKYVPEDEYRPLRAIEAAEAWTRGEATSEQVRGAEHAAYAALQRASGATASYAAKAAYAAARAAYVWDAAARAAYAWDAACAAARAAANLTVAKAAMCDIIRAMWPTPPVRECRKEVA